LGETGQGKKRGVGPEFKKRPSPRGGYPPILGPYKKPAREKKGGKGEPLFVPLWDLWFLGKKPPPGRILSRNSRGYTKKSKPGPEKWTPLPVKKGGAPIPAWGEAQPPKEGFKERGAFYRRKSLYRGGPQNAGSWGEDIPRRAKKKLGYPLWGPRENGGGET